MANMHNQFGQPPMQPPYGQPGPGYPSETGYPPQGGMAPVSPSAPPVAFDSLKGYEETRSSDPVVVGPPPVDNVSDRQRPQEHFDQGSFINDEQAAEALKSFAAENCCYGSKPAKEVSVKELKPSSAYHYILETFAETRETNWHQEPYKGQPIDGPMNGVPPSPWMIYVPAPAPFSPGESSVEVPHTASVKPCPSCMGSGSKICTRCQGSGRDKCNNCRGNGHIHRPDGEHERCHVCHGDGRIICHHCHGNGREKCSKCEGCCQVKVYIRLTVKWKTHKGEHVVEKSALPSELVTQVSGNVIFSQELPLVWPISTFFEHEINQASQRLVTSHNESLKTSKILMQRHSLRAVPVTEALGIWKDDTFSFWVYGYERKVYCPDYPQKCCCGCVLI